MTVSSELRCLSCKRSGCLTHLTASHGSCGHVLTQSVSFPLFGGVPYYLPVNQQAGLELAVVFNCFSPCFVISNAF